MRGYVVCNYKNINDESSLKNYADITRLVVENIKANF